MLTERNQIEIQNDLQASMEKDGLDTLLVFSPENVFYCTGFASNWSYLGRIPGTAIGIIPSKGKCKLIVNNAEEKTARAQCKDIDIEAFNTFVFIDDTEDSMKEKPVEMGLGDSWKVAMDLMSQLTPNRKIGIERSFLPWDVGEELSTRFGKHSLVDSEPTLYKVRLYKKEWEVKQLRKAAQLAEAGMFETARRTEPGMTEKDLMAIWNTSVFQANKDIRDAYMAPSIGPWYSPAYIPHDYVIKDGDIIRLDGGPSVFGYRSDIGRTFSVGKPSQRKMEIFEALLAGYKKGVELIGPGVKLSTVFNEVQQLVRKKGIPNYTRGHVGHSIGLYVFQEEPPCISTTEECVFEPGMVFCMETPYFSEINGGYIIEDTLLITESGHELFTKTNESLVWPE